MNTQPRHPHISRGEFPCLRIKDLRQRPEGMPAVTSKPTLQESLKGYVLCLQQSGQIYRTEGTIYRTTDHNDLGLSTDCLRWISVQ